MTQPCHKDTPLNQQRCDSKHKGRRGTGQRKGVGQCKRGKNNVKGRTPSQQRDNTQPTTPAIQQDHHVNEEGDTTHKTGMPNNTAALTHHATHHRSTHPPFCDGPTLHHDEGGAHRGYPTTRTTQTHTHHPHTTHPAKNSARHDSSTRQHCSEMSRARAAPLHWTGQQQHTPPPFHTPRRMDTIHSSTHPLSHCSRSHCQRSTMINEQQSMFND